MVRIIAILALFFVTGSRLLAQQSDDQVKAGDQLVLRMTGELAKEYAWRTGLLDKGDAREGLQVETTVTIAQKKDGGRVRIEHWSEAKRVGETSRLVTLTGTVDETAITTDIVSKGTAVYASPGAKPVLTTEDRKMLRLNLSDLKGLKLRSWTLSDETGE